MDFITDMPVTSASDSPWSIPGFDTFDQLLTVTCLASKRCLLIPGYARFSAADWGMPTTIISDRDRRLNGEVWVCVAGHWKSAVSQSARPLQGDQETSASLCLF